MASVTFLAQANMAAQQVWYGNLTGATATAITISNGFSTGVYEGQFRYDAYGNVGGLLTGFTEYRGTATVAVISGIAVDAAAAAKLIGANQLNTLYPAALSGTDAVIGSMSADVLLSFGGNDFIEGRGGNDSLDGGAGIDTAVFSGTSSQYAIARIGISAYQVTDTVANRNGIDTLNNVERLHFTDRTIALDIEGNAGQVYRLYQAAFGRTPDTPGLTHNVAILDNGVSLHGMAAAFAGSPEFSGRYGAGSSDATFVTALYQNVLHRAPDAGGFANWTGALAAGALDRGSVLMGFSESAENKALVGVSIANGITLDNLI